MYVVHNPTMRQKLKVKLNTFKIKNIKKKISKENMNLKVN